MDIPRIFTGQSTISASALNSHRKLTQVVRFVANCIKNILEKSSKSDISLENINITNKYYDGIKKNLCTGWKDCSGLLTMAYEHPEAFYGRKKPRDIFIR